MLSLFTDEIMNIFSASTITAQIGSIEPLTGSNFPSWKSSLLIVLGMNDLDYALRVEEPKAPEAGTEDYEALRSQYLANSEKWERSNRLSGQIMKNSISEGIRGAIPDNENAKSYLESVEEHYKGTSKFYAATLMQKLHNARYDLSKGSVREHIMQIIDAGTQLKKMKAGMDDDFLVHYVLASLPHEFEAFKCNYRTTKEKWSISDLIAMCVQEEERINAERRDVVNQVGSSSKKNQGGNRGRKRNNTYAPYKKPQQSSRPA